MILIVASRDDHHAVAVARQLALEGAPFRFVDSSRVTTEGRLSFTAGAEGRSTWTCIDGRPVALETATTVWHRRRFMPPMAALPDARDAAFLERQWRELFTGVFSTLGAFFVNDPLRQEAAVKPLQLRLAGELGLRIPQTLISNDPAAVRAFVESHHGQVVHKALAASRHRFIGTTRWSPDQDGLLDDLVLSPLIFQEVITDCRELRVTVVGEALFAAEFRPPDGLIDGRLNLDVPYLPHALPRSIAEKLLALVRRLGLVYSTVDLKLTNEGEYVFLELNPQGQFLYVELLSGLPLTAAMSSLLRDQIHSRAA